MQGNAGPCAGGRDIKPYFLQAGIVDLFLFYYGSGVVDYSVGGIGNLQCKALLCVSGG